MSTRPVGDRPSQRPVSGAVRMRRAALALAGCGVLCVGLAACETTEQESAKIGHESEAAAKLEAKQAAKKHSRPRSHAPSHGAAHAKPRSGSAASGHGSPSP